MTILNNNISLDISALEIKQLIEVFDLLPDTIFWVKDANSRFVYANSTFLEQVSIGRVEGVIGKTDFDISPSYLAKQYVADDQLLQQGINVTDRLELNLLNKGTVAWFSTSKRPIMSAAGEFLGSYGIPRHFERVSATHTHIRAVDAPVRFIRDNFKNAITVEQIADAAHLSVSALERRFKKHLSKTPRQLLNEIRLEYARKLLIESDLAIAQIAFECGFADHSYFSKQFRLLFGELPSTFREQYSQSLKDVSEDI